MSHEPTYPPELARYSRQMLFAPIGIAGQRRLKQASVTLVGCGALGGALANLLVRAGVGALRIVDRDFIELNNLQRQTLFDEHDIAQNLPKAEAAARKLRKINSAVEIEGIVGDVNPGNIVAHCGDADLLLDGTDNLETRYLVNDFAVQQSIPWVFGACLAAEGLVLPILPHQGPCLRCVWEEPPPPGATPTCNTVGILAATVNVVASLAATEAMKILTGHERDLNLRLLAIDVWAGRMRAVNVQSAFDAGNCPCCKQGRYDFLTGDTAATTTLGGRDAVQIPAGGDVQISFKAIAARLPAQAHAKFNEFMLRFNVESYSVTLFADGRAIIQGTSDPTVARGVYAKYVGM